MVTRYRLVTLVCGILLSSALSGAPAETVSAVTLEVLPNAAVIRVFGRSQIHFIADLFWVRMANMASRVSNAREAALLLPLGNLIAELDPSFRYPYLVGGVMAPWRRGRTKTYDNAAEAVGFMARGIQHVPWQRLFLQKAYTELEMLHDPASAGRTLAAAARYPDALPHVGLLAARLLAEGRNLEGAREIAQWMATSNNPQIRDDGERRLKQIDLEEVLNQVDQAIAQFEEIHRRKPSSLNELVRQGLLPGEPVDPLGGRIIVDENGPRSSVVVGRLRRYVPLGDE